MRMKPFAITLAAIGLVFRLANGNQERADDHLQSFYKDMLSANFASACRSIDEAIRLWPTNGRYYGWRAYCTSQKLPSQCLRGSHGASPRLRPEDAADARAALEDYTQALRLNARDSVAHHNRAWLGHLLGDDMAAAKDWQQAIAIDPDNATFYLSYGMFLEEAGDLKGAETQYRSAIELSPGIVDSPFFTQYRSRATDAADSVISEVIARIEKLQQGRDPILEARLGKLYEFRGDLGRAEALLEDSADQLPSLPLVWLNLGELHQMQGNMNAAMNCYTKARALKALVAGAYLGIGEIELLSQRKSEAAQNFRLAIAGWQRANPITAVHNNRLYAGPRQIIDDLLPTTLVWYTTPCEASRAWQGLAQLFPGSQEYGRRVRTCEQLPSPHIYDKRQ